MNLGDPTRAITPTLDGPVLAVLATAGKPLTVGEIAGLAARGSEIGIRRTVARLVNQGIVVATQMGRNQVHELNRDHLAAEAVLALADLRLVLWRRLRKVVSSWPEPAVHACVFGSAARGDGNEDSDIDILLVHHPDPEDLHGTGDGSILGQVVELLGKATARKPAQTARWRRQVDDLQADVQRWTGNRAQVVDLGFPRWAALKEAEPDLYQEIEHDKVVLTESSPSTRLSSRVDA